MQLELLALAGNKEIGIAAIDCGADSVYIAGPRFGARQAAGNPVAEVGELARYAHRYDARVYAVVNTILFDDELEAARQQMWELAEAGVDAFIIQDLGLLKMELPALPLFASTQTVIRTPEAARRMESLGFRRLILERQLSLEEIRAIRSAVRCDLEFFVHGALCMSYSGQCYLSQALTGRSANRGACVQACRSLYNLVDADGRVLLHDRSLLSLKDFRLDDRLGDLIGAGVSSFKIEGRLKNASYVKNVVRHYRARLDEWLEHHPEDSRASAGRPVGGFSPELDATFNRGYTTAFLDGRGGRRHSGLDPESPDDRWNSVDAAKSMGAYLGTIRAVEGDWIVIDTDRTLAAGDGLAFVSRGGELSGMRVESVAGAASESRSGATAESRSGATAESRPGAAAESRSGAAAGQRVRLKNTAGRYRGEKVYRNLDVAFERELERNMPRRLIDAVIDYRTAGGQTTFTARIVDTSFADRGEKALQRNSLDDSKITKVLPPLERGRTLLNSLDYNDIHCKVSFRETADVARNPETALESLRSQLSKTTEPYRFTLGTVEADAVYFYPAAFLNGIRRDLAAALADKSLSHSEIRKVLPLPEGGSSLSNSQNFSELSAKAKTPGVAEAGAEAEAEAAETGTGAGAGAEAGAEAGVAEAVEAGTGAGAGAAEAAESAGAALDYRANCANRLAREVLTELGAESVAPAYELEAPRGAEVMRSRYCLKYELGLCPRRRPKSAAGESPKAIAARDLREPLYLENNGRRLQLKFDCKNCEMVVLL